MEKKLLWKLKEIQKRQSEQKKTFHSKIAGMYRIEFSNGKVRIWVLN